MAVICILKNLYLKDSVHNAQCVATPQFQQ